MKFYPAEPRLDPPDQARPVADRPRADFTETVIIEASRAMGCTHVLSEDLSDGQDYGGVRVTNPFR